jgi:hypothetical protein
MTGLKPQSHMEAALKAPYIADGTHPVPISNFLNAQCTCQSSPCSVAKANRPRLLRDLSRYSSPDVQGHSRHWKLQPLGSLAELQLDCLLPSHQVRLFGVVDIQEERHRFRDSLRIRIA